jgi:CheY-like chemotaxis protein
MSRALICSERPLDDDLRRTLIWREDVNRYHADDWQDALGVARHLPVDVVLVDAELPGSVDLVRAIRSEPLTKRIAVAVLAREGAESAFDGESGGGGVEILHLPPGSDWDDPPGPPPQRDASPFPPPARRRRRVRAGRGQRDAHRRPAT